MNIPNIKVYLAVSFALIVLLILVLVIPFGKKTTTGPQNPTGIPAGINFPTPTTVETHRTKITPGQVTPTEVVFTGVKEETLPPELVNLSTQKQALRHKTPLNLTTFNIAFDYGLDKFIVTLNEPKDQSQKEFESWRTANYPALGSEQFVMK